MRSGTMARSALALGIVGLFTAGLCGLGAVLGLGMGIAAIGQARRSGDEGSVAWAAVSANLFALLSIAPWILLVVTLRPMLPELMAANPFAEPELPQPYEPTPSLDVAPALVPPPPPPPPAPRRSPAAAASRPAGGSEQASDVADGKASERLPPQGLRVGGAIHEPRKIRHVNPVYPAIARSARVQGIVIHAPPPGPGGQRGSLPRGPLVPPEHLPAGTYYLEVNGVTGSFTIP